MATAPSPSHAAFLFSPQSHIHTPRLSLFSHPHRFSPPSYRHCRLSISCCTGGGGGGIPVNNNGGGGGGEGDGSAKKDKLYLLRLSSDVEAEALSAKLGKGRMLDINDARCPGFFIPEPNCLLAMSYAYDPENLSDTMARFFIIMFVLGFGYIGLRDLVKVSQDYLAEIKKRDEKNLTYEATERRKKAMLIRIRFSKYEGCIIYLNLSLTMFETL